MIDITSILDIVLNKMSFVFQNDKNYLRLKYLLLMKRKINIEKPITYNEKLQWLKLYDRKPEYTKMVDKYEVKDYVAKQIGEKYIIPTIGVWDKFEDIDFAKLPNKFVLKCTHDSGGIFICKDKSEFDIAKAKKKIKKSLKRNYYYSGREWPYKNVKPRIIIEEYMYNGNEPDLFDYKFMCFNGKVMCSFVCSERYLESGLKITFFDRDWKRMPFQRKYNNSDIEIEKPKNYDLMIELAEKLSKNIPFVRVDFYEIDGNVYFGELTFFPGGGFEPFYPEEWDIKLGNMLELPKEKIGDKNEK